MLGFRALHNQGNSTTLWAAFLYFDLSFMIWLLLGPISSEISDTLMTNGFLITPTQESTLLAVPILSGALLRIFLGLLVGRIGAKKTALIAQMIVIFTLFYVARLGTFITYEELLIVGIGLGFAGGSFAIALPQAGQWYPQRLQGAVLGIAGMGNVGVIMSFLFAPKIAELWGWQTVFLIAGILALVIFAAYSVMASDAPPEVYKGQQRKLSDYLKLFKDKDTWWFSLFYLVSFGTFVGFSLYMKVYLLGVYFDDMEILGEEVFQEENILVVAGGFAALCIMAGAFMRPVGGTIADKIGGIKALYIFFSLATMLLFLNAFIQLPFWIAILVMFMIMANLGMANGAVFQLVPQRFAKDIGVMTGIIGASGALGGVAVLEILGTSTLKFGDYTIGFILIAILTLFAMAGLSYVKGRWRTTWGVHSGGII